MGTPRIVRDEGFIRARSREDAHGCWNWSLRLDRHGYGRVKGHDGGSWLAHRVAFEILRGPIPEGLELDHLCRNARCVNPDHLEPVTHKENIRRSDAIARATAASIKARRARRAEEIRDGR